MNGPNELAGLGRTAEPARADQHYSWIHNIKRMSQIDHDNFKGNENLKWKLPTTFIDE